MLHRSLNGLSLEPAFSTGLWSKRRPLTLTIIAVAIHIHHHILLNCCVLLNGCSGLATLLSRAGLAGQLLCGRRRPLRRGCCNQTLPNSLSAGAPRHIAGPFDMTQACTPAHACQVLCGSSALPLCCALSVQLGPTRSISACQQQASNMTRLLPLMLTAGREWQAHLAGQSAAHPLTHRSPPAQPCAASLQFRVDASVATAAALSFTRKLRSASLQLSGSSTASPRGNCWQQVQTEQDLLQQALAGARRAGCAATSVRRCRSGRVCCSKR